MFFGDKGELAVLTRAHFLRYWLPALLWASLIGLFSTGLFDAQATGKLFRAVLRFFLPGISGETMVLVHFLTRKLAHVVEYFVFTWLLYRAFRQDRADQHWRWALFAALLALGAAGLDELHQHFVPRRRGSPLDVGLDGVGVVLAQVLLFWRHRSIPG
jgi:VanZ family protein